MQLLHQLLETPEVSEHLWKSAAASLVLANFLDDFCACSGRLHVPVHMRSLFVSRSCSKSAYRRVDASDAKHLTISLATPVLLMTGHVTVFAPDSDAMAELPPELTSAASSAASPRVSIQPAVVYSKKEVSAPFFFTADAKTKVTFSSECHVLLLRNMGTAASKRVAAANLRTSTLRPADLTAATAVQRFNTRHRGTNTGIGTARDLRDARHKGAQRRKRSAINVLSAQSSSSSSHSPTMTSGDLVLLMTTSKDGSSNRHPRASPRASPAPSERKTAGNSNGSVNKGVGIGLHAAAAAAGDDKLPLPGVGLGGGGGGSATGSVGADSKAGGDRRGVDIASPTIGEINNGEFSGVGRGMRASESFACIEAAFADMSPLVAVRKQKQLMALSTQSSFDGRGGSGGDDEKDATDGGDDVDDEAKVAMYMSGASSPLSSGGGTFGAQLRMDAPNLFDDADADEQAFETINSDDDGNDGADVNGSRSTSVVPVRARLRQPNVGGTRRQAMSAITASIAMQRLSQGMKGKMRVLVSQDAESRYGLTHGAGGGCAHTRLAEHANIAVPSRGNGSGGGSGNYGGYAFKTSKSNNTLDEEGEKDVLTAVRHSASMPSDEFLAGHSHGNGGASVLRTSSSFQSKQQSGKKIRVAPHTLLKSASSHHLKDSKNALKRSATASSLKSGDGSDKGKGSVTPSSSRWGGLKKRFKSLTHTIIEHASHESRESAHQRASSYGGSSGSSSGGRSVAEEGVLDSPVKHGSRGSKHRRSQSVFTPRNSGTGVNFSLDRDESDSFEMNDAGRRHAVSRDATPIVDEDGEGGNIDDILIPNPE
jgi:hypothetical protein